MARKNRKGAKWTPAQRAKFNATMARKRGGLLVAVPPKPTDDQLLDRLEREAKHQQDRALLATLVPAEPATLVDTVAKLIVAVARELAK